MATFNLSTQILALFFSCISWTIHVATFILAFRTLFQSKTLARSRLFWQITTSVACAMALLGTIDLSMQLTMTLQETALVPAPQSFVIVTQFDSFLQALIADAFLIYRLFIVYSRAWAISTVAIVLWLGQLACTIMMAYYIHTSHNSSSASTFVFGRASQIAQPAFTTALNVFVTGAIMWKIYSAEHHTRRAQSETNPDPNFSRAKQLLIESASVNTLLQVIYLALLAVSSPANTPVAALITQTMGISFGLIVVRVNKVKLGKAVKSDSMLSRSTSQRTAGSQRSSKYTYQSDKMSVLSLDYV